jgi:CheY-like chemotaxis protein
MPHGILLVDDQRDILRLLHSTLDTLNNKDLEIFESPSGEEALLSAGRHKIDLLVSDYLLPGMTGIELMHKVRVRNPDVRVILISGMTDRKARDEMLNAGATALFDKPIPLADFLDVVERSLGLVRTIFPTPSGSRDEAKRARVSDLLANFRQDMQAQAIFLLNERGMVLARAGALVDSSTEVSLLSALIAIFNAGLKVSRLNRQETLDQYFVFDGGDHDLLLVPVTGMYALLLAGSGLTARDTLLDTLQALLAVRDEVERSLRSMGVTSELTDGQPTVPIPSVGAATGAAAPAAAPAPGPVKKKGKTGDLAAAPPSPEMESLLKDAAGRKVKQQEMDDFWTKAAAENATKTTNPEVISYDEARKRGLTPDSQN